MSGYVAPVAESGKPLLEAQIAAMRYYVGQTDKINGEFDPMTCTIKRPEGYDGPSEFAQPEPEPPDHADETPVLKTAAQRKAEKNRKKREQKKRAKLAAKGKDPNQPAAVTVASNGWSSRAVPVPRGPSDVRAEKPATQDQMLRELGFGRREREKLQTFERLTRLTGLVDEMPDLHEGDKRASVNEILQELVEDGGNVDHITDARQNCARLTGIATDLVKEVDYIIKYPDEANGRDVTDLYPLRDSLNTLVSELSSRAGEPELMKTEAAERMRQKLEKKLLPKLQTSIPKWAEQLRFMHADVLKWSRPEASQVLVKQEQEARAAAARAAQLAAQKQADLEKTWTAPEEENPAPDDEELRVLQAMGWREDGCDDEDDFEDPTTETEEDPVPELEDPVAATAAAEPDMGSGSDEHEQSVGTLVPADQQSRKKEADAEVLTEPFQIDPTNEFVASPGLDTLTRKLQSDAPQHLASALFLLGGGEGLRVPWGDAQLAGGIAAQGQFKLLRKWGMGAALPAGPDPDDTCSGNQQVVDDILRVIGEHHPDVEDDGYGEKSKAFDNEVIEGDDRQPPLTHEEVHQIVDRYAGMPQPAPGGGEAIDLLTAPKHPYRTQAAHDQSIEVSRVIREARQRGASDFQLLSCFRFAMKQKVKAARQAEQGVIRKEGLSTAAGRLAMETGASQQDKERLALSQGFSAAEVLAAREEGLDLVGTKKVLEAIENATPPNWRVLDAARFAKKHKEETDAEQYIFTDEARTLMSWDLSKIARHAMALGIDSDYIADVMRQSSSYGSIEEPDELPEDDKQTDEAQAELRRQMHLRSETVKRQTLYHEQQEGNDTVNVQSVEWEMVGPIVSQSKGIHHHLRFLPIQQLVKRAEEVGVPKKQRKAARKDRSALCRAILAHRFLNPQPVEIWTGGLGVKQRDPFSVQERLKPAQKPKELPFNEMLQRNLRAKPS